MEAGTERNILCCGEILYGFLPAAPGAVGAANAMPRLGEVEAFLASRG